MRFYDNTRLDAARVCLRKYYYRHILHWEPSGTAKPLIFGAAWHSGQDGVWRGFSETDDKNKVHALACAEFLATWHAEGGPDYDETWNLNLESDWTPRTPGIAFALFKNYIELREQFIGEHELVSCEQPFVVELPDLPDVLYCGKLDKHIQHRASGAHAFVEHKTSSMYSKQFGIQENALLDVNDSPQVMGQLFFGKAQYDDTDGFQCVYTDFALTHKTRHDVFKLFPLDVGLEYFDQWLYDVQELIDTIEIHKARLQEARDAGTSEGFTYMPAFPRNSTGCITKYGRCPYYETCHYNPNPERLHETPAEFVINKWSPFEALHLEQLGFETDEGDQT